MQFIPLFLCLNKILREVRLSITFRYISMIYYLKCNMSNKKETYLGKQSGITMLGSNLKLNNIYQNLEKVIPQLSFRDMFLVMVHKIKI